MLHLVLDNNGSSDHLHASWLSPAGGVDLYLVTLSALGSTPQERRLPPNITQVVFEGLTPGCSYQLCVRSSAGGRSSDSCSRGRTGSQTHLYLTDRPPVTELSV